jgi:hypothetical protein
MEERLEACLKKINPEGRYQFGLLAIFLAMNFIAYHNFTISFFTLEPSFQCLDNGKWSDCKGEDACKLPKSSYKTSYSWGSWVEQYNLECE